MTSRLHHRIFIALIGIFLLTAGCLVAVVYSYLSLYLHQQAKTRITELGGDAAYKLSEFFYDAQTDLEAWTRLQVMQDAAVGDLDQRIAVTLTQLRHDYDLPGHLYVFDAQGRLTSSTHAGIARGRPLPQAWRKPLSAQVAWFENKHPHPWGGETIVALCHELRSRFSPSQAIGVIVLTVPWRYLDRFLERDDASFHLLFGPGGQLLYADPQFARPELTQLRKHQGAELELGTRRYQIALHRVSVPYSPLLEKWRIYTLIDQAIVTAPAVSLLYRLGLAFLLLIFPIGMLILWFTRLLIRPIRELTRIVSHIAATGDMSQRVPVTANDEIGQLAGRFNTLIHQLEETLAGKTRLADELAQFNQVLEQTVQDRTAELAWQAHHDPLTRLPNRALLTDRLEQAIQRTRRAGDRKLAVLFLDLDGFKQVNDTHGHEAGDRLLVEIARRLRHALRDEDTVARLGGDEFVILLEDLPDLAALEDPLERIQAAITTPISLGDTTVTIGTSIGVTLFPDDPGDSDTLLRHADQAMYEAKHSGRNRYHLFDPEAEQQLQCHHEARHCLEKALEEGRLQLHYQPLIHMRTNQVIGVEALLRWNDEEGRLHPPQPEISLVENTSVIIEIGEWVLHEALRQIAAWSKRGIDFSISVNLSAHHIQKPGFLADLDRILAHYPKECARRLKIEIVESASLENIDQAHQVIRACKERGIIFALDDFGTGYSSLTYLKRLGADIIKIDRSFVLDMLEDADDAALVRSIVEMGRVFRQTLIAEGVETETHRQRLLEMGCEIGQGYGLARPMTVTQLEAWYRETVLNRGDRANDVCES